MSKIGEHSDYQYDNPEQPVALKAKLRIRYYVDAEGYACFLVCKYKGKVVKTIPFEIAGPWQEGEPDMVTAAAAYRHKFALPEIVMGLTPAGEPWPLDEDGRGLSVMEVTAQLKEKAA